ncbi:type IV-A pilus assembly ATPase PilB [Hippea maritima]|uniref:protein-secreting ATPase n=1 Tax=Hippea maritima (strain ATCC 700847 / DSM 10411 / MH2) TaxID=760142 RepID=F2LUC2_HIPMA|nr:type IV-A pilus assembly ATPase PilB [Hippea maritima]AEA33448.1 type IV-A pilus assembly ATPase PilB [Hippea maritima DSM 10411]
MTTLLGQLLLWNNVITQQQLDEALEEQKKSKKKLGTILIEKGFVDEKILNDFLSKQYGVESVDLNSIDISKDVIKKVPPQIAKKYTLIPVAIEKNKIKVAISDPTNIFALDEVRFVTGMNVIPLFSNERSILRAIDKYYGTSTELEEIADEIAEFSSDVNVIKEEEEAEDVKDLERSAEDEPIIKLANTILSRAVVSGASDIHIEPYENELRIRYRIDGKLKTIMTFARSMAPKLTSRIKIMSKLNIAEKRLPQDGRIRIKVSGKDIDLRVSTLPTVYGEKVVMRILDRSNVRVDLEKLGFEDDDLTRYLKAIQKPYGMILVTGPTGSGKSTTLYASLNKINKDDVNIMTVEDPVEYNLDGINQVHVKEDIGLTFASALRSFLRQDPDIIMVGEIRDSETAEIAIRAALTGHLVFSTLHTNDAPSTVMRLVDMGIERYLIASSLILVLAQRLVRKICPYCKKQLDVPPEALEEIGFSKEEAKTVKVYKGEGCDYCNETGYKGRVALYEVMPISEKIRRMILESASVEEIRKQAIEEGMATLRMSGLKKIKEGVTTIEEVMNVTFN